MMDVNPSESTPFRVIQSSPAEEFNTVSPLPALGQADAATADESEPLPAETNKPEIESPGAAVPQLPASEEIKQAAACSVQPAGKTDSPSRKKGKSVDSALFLCVILSLNFVVIKHLIAI